MRESFHWRYAVGFALILLGAGFIFNPFAGKPAHGGSATTTPDPATFPIYSAPEGDAESKP